LPLLEAVEQAKRFVERGLRFGLAIGAGQGPLCHWHPLLESDG
jgi:hydroxymethylpyrimidine/phosphomethylpyrimidine kinase